MNSDRVRLAMIRARVVLPHPGGPQKSIELRSSRSICVRRGFPGAEQIFLPDELIERLRTHAVGERPPRLRRFLRFDGAKQSHLRHALLCRAASYSNSDAATAAFSDSTASLIGMEMVASAPRVRPRAASPAPSLPMKSRDGPAQIVVRSSGLRVAPFPGCLVARNNLYPMHFQLREQNWRRNTAHHGSRRPIRPTRASALGDHGSAVPRVVATPVAPKASADRKIVPTLPGS